VTTARRQRGRVHDRVRDRGAAAVEFALVLPLLMLLVLGCVDWGYYFYIDQLVTNGAREGARAGAVADAAVSDPYVVARNAALQYLTDVRLTAAATVNADPDVIAGSNAVRVSIRYPVGSITGFLRPTAGVDLVPPFALAVAVMRLEQ
jgi:Flp pilus assembly protein TadG